jgi:cbb3-type cytochrome oxidase subunit 3
MLNDLLNKYGNLSDDQKQYVGNFVKSESFTFIMLIIVGIFIMLCFMAFFIPSMIPMLIIYVIMMSLFLISGIIIYYFYEENKKKVDKSLEIALKLHNQTTTLENSYVKDSIYNDYNLLSDATDLKTRVEELLLDAENTAKLNPSTGQWETCKTDSITKKKICTPVDVLNNPSTTVSVPSENNSLIVDFIPMYADSSNLRLITVLPLENTL